MGDEEEWARLPLSEQFVHKNWKARKLGYEAATKAFNTAQPHDAVVRDFTFESGLWKGALGDSNVAAQQEALNAYNAFLNAAGTDGARKTRATTIAPIVEKGLMGRPAAKQAAMESLLLLIELDKADVVVEEMLLFNSNKQPKLVAAAVAALTSVVHAYGCKIVEPKPILKILPKLFGHADKNVRAEAQNLTVEMYRWLREAMKPLFWGELKPVQQTDLEKLFVPVQSEPPATQERLLRSQQAAKAEAAAAPTADAYADDEAEEIPIDLEPEFISVDVASKLPKDFGDRIASTKWKDRKDVLDEVYAAVNVPAIQDGHFDELVRGCAKGMKDANVTVVVVAANVIECLAKGLRKHFAKYRSTVLAPMLERFKEKKASVTDAISAACDAVFAGTNLGDIQADSLEALKNKNPAVKENTAKFIARSFTSTKEVPTLEQTKEYADGAKKLLTEGAAPLRDAGAEILGIMWKIMGDRNMLVHFEGVDEIRKTKIKEYCDAAEVRVKWKPKTAPAPARTAPATTGKRSAPVKKAPTTTKRPVPPPVSPPPVIEDEIPAPRSISRPVSKPPGSLRPPGTSIKPPSSGLAKPAAGPKAPASVMTSPKRQGVVFDEPPSLAPPKTPMAAPRSLAARPLAKAHAPASPPMQPREIVQPSSMLSAMEKQELHELRTEMDLARQQISDLRQDKLRLSSQINELTNQNAQLIEDHTRDVLQIKAKETQLVRARSDAETAEDKASSMSREIERLKREMSRLGRQSAGRESPVDLINGTNHHYQRPQLGSRPYTMSFTNGSDFNTFGTIAENGEEGKENLPQSLDGHKLSEHVSDQVRQARPLSSMSSGRGTPVSLDSSGAAAGRGQGDGVESWRRAAEVTQNLKARIEMMKVNVTVAIL